LEILPLQPLLGEALSSIDGVMLCSARMPKVIFMVSRFSVIGCEALRASGGTSSCGCSAWPPILGAPSTSRNVDDPALESEPPL